MLSYLLGAFIGKEMMISRQVFSAAQNTLLCIAQHHFFVATCRGSSLDLDFSVYKYSFDLKVLEHVKSKCPPDVVWVREYGKACEGKYLKQDKILQILTATIEKKAHHCEVEV